MSAIFFRTGNCHYSLPFATPELRGAVSCSVPPKMKFSADNASKMHELLKGAGVKNRHRREAVLAGTDGQKKHFRLVISTIRRDSTSNRLRSALNGARSREAICELVQRLIRDPCEFATAEVRRDVARIKETMAGKDARALALQCAHQPAALSLSNEKLYGKGIQSMKCE